MEHNAPLGDHRSTRDGFVLDDAHGTNRPRPSPTVGGRLGSPGLDLLEGTAAGSPARTASRTHKAEPGVTIGRRPGAVRVLAHRGLRRLARRLEAAGLVRGVTR